MLGRGSPSFFPPKPRGLKGRAGELAALEASIVATAPARLALVGSGGSGKSMLACALGHAMKSRFDGGIHWFRVGAWDSRTLLEMLALRFGTSRERAELAPGLRAFLSLKHRLIVLDNHEDDRATARLLDALSDTRATFVITARRCLLAGVTIYPVTAPLVASGRSAFPRVAKLTRVLRWNPLALDIADALVSSGALTLGELAAHLEREGVSRVRVIDHEDDLPEVSSLVAWAWARLPHESRRMLAVLAHVQGDHVDEASLAKLARVPAGRAAEALAPLVAWHLVQEPFSGRFALHAVVRYALQKRTKPDDDRVFAHYLAMLDESPERIVLEQTNLFAAMDHAHKTGDMAGMLRIERLLAKLGA